MTSLTRLWILATTPAGELHGDLPAGLAERDLAAVAGPAGPALDALAGNRPRALVQRLAGLEQASPAASEALTELAAGFPGVEVALCLAPDVLREILTAVLAGSQAHDPQPGTLVALDWPDGTDAGVHAQCIGVDLDWWPPWQAGAPRSRYPGGPGAAGSARA